MCLARARRVPGEAGAIHSSSQTGLHRPQHVVDWTLFWPNRANGHAGVRRDRRRSAPWRSLPWMTMGQPLLPAPRSIAGTLVAKLGSNPAREHSGCGTVVFEASVAWAEQHGARRIFILTNSALKPAIHIYESHGFRRIQTDDFEGYSRGDYALEKVVRQ